MNILVTGGNGFIGKHVTELLRKNNHIVFVGTRGLCRNSIQFFMDNLSWMNDCIIKNKIECIIHLSANSSVSKSFLYPFEIFESNVQDSINLLKVIFDKNIRFIFASSSEIYKLDDKVLTEESDIQPINFYGMSKAYVDFFTRSLKFSSVILRLFSVVGPGQSETFVLSSFAKQIVEMKLGKRERVLRVGNLNVCRDFVDVRDVARLFLIMCESEEIGCVYNVCSGICFSLKNCIEELKHLSGVSDIKIEVDEKLLRSIDTKTLCGSYEKVYNKYKWKPEITLRQTLTDLLEYWERELK
jgi:GDP-4-dehydro-6-deoxy-D-mannose reductase